MAITMTPPSKSPLPNEVTHLLHAWRDGDHGALDELLPLVYSELRRLAASYLRRERSDHTLQATALVHEAYIRLVNKTHPRWHDRVHFYAVAAQLMRRLLVDHARAYRAIKRGGSAVRVPLQDETAIFSPDRAADLLALDAALTNLTQLDPRKARILELRFFGGLTLAETAQVLEVSTATVVNEARLARAFLYDQIGDG